MIAALLALSIAGIGPAAGERVIQMEYDAANDSRRRGKKKEAAERFEALAADHPTSRLASRALASAGAIQQWDLGDIDKAVSLYDRVLKGPDDRPGIMPALIQRLGIERDRAGPRAELAFAEKLDRARPNASYAPWLLLHAASILADDLADPKRALAPLERIRKSFAKSTRADEALMKEAELLRRLGRPREALRLYRAIIDTESSSLVVGDYNSTKLDDAYYQTGETCRRDLKDGERALEAYEALVEHLPLSRLVDDALAHAAEVAAERGDLARSAKDLDRLAKLRPGSRYLGKPRRRP
jgi:tetratricopeptide (TPR) repeat protein